MNSFDFNRGQQSSSADGNYYTVIPSQKQASEYVLFEQFYIFYVKDLKKNI